jgi:hypothetical protein
MEGTMPNLRIVGGTDIKDDASLAARGETPGARRTMRMMRELQAGPTDGRFALAAGRLAGAILVGACIALLPASLLRTSAPAASAGIASANAAPRDEGSSSGTTAAVVPYTPASGAVGDGMTAP